MKKTKLLFIKNGKINSICISMKNKKGYKFNELKCKRPQYIKNGVVIMSKRGVGYRGDLIKILNEKFLIVEGEG